MIPPGSGLGYSTKRLELVLPPMLGHVGANEARVWMAASRSTRLGLVLSLTQGFNDGLGLAFEGPLVDPADGGMGHVVADGLTPATRYFYFPTLDGRPALQPPYPSLVTAPPEGQPGRVRFGFSSCVGEEGRLATAAYGEMAAAHLDFLLMLGDSTYANTNEPVIQRRFYADQRRTRGWASLAPGTPLYAIWDDHDYGSNNSDGRMPGKEKSLQTFKEMWANPGYGEPENPGVYFKFRRRDVEFFMLDGRYHRDPNAASNLVHKTMLGTGQVAWLKRELRASQAAIKVLASGGEWQSDGTRDSWTSFREERDDILGFIEKEGISGVLLISGDRHFSAAYQVRGRWIEVTSGPLGSPPIVVKNLPEMFLNLSETKGHFYSIYDLDTAVSPPTVSLEIYRVGRGLAYQRRFTWDEIQGVTKLPVLPAPPPEKEKDKRKGRAQGSVERIGRRS
jgi:alkaline phosphatase D